MTLFLIAPPVLFFINAGFSGMLDLFLFYLYLSCAILRLAHFNLYGLDRTEGRMYYTGLPITYASLVFPLAYALEKFLPSGVFVMLIRTSFLLVSVLLIVRVPVPRPSGISYIIFPVIAFSLTFYFLTE